MKSKFLNIFSKVAAVLCFVLLCAMLLIACYDNTTPPDSGQTDDGKLTYTVSVVDYKGNAPAVDVLIEIQKDGEMVGMKKADVDGKVSFELERGDYTFIPTSADGAFYYDEAACVLSESAPNADVTLYQITSEKRTIYPYFEELNDRQAYEAAIVKEGATYVEIDRPEMSYYIFAPTRGGVYKFTYISESALTLGYFGDANVVLTESAAKVENRAFELEIKNGSIGDAGSGGTLNMVIGLRSLKEKNAILVIERVGDPAQEILWTDLMPEQKPNDFEKNDALNHELVNVSVTDPSVKLVYNEADGYYHYGSETGPIVYVRISSASPYLASFKEICETTRMYKIFYDESGNVVKKESYNDIINAYAEICDSRGICPLTDEIIYVIQSNAEQMKWWDFGATGNNIFDLDADGNETDVNQSNLVTENAWMFACCYISEFVYGGADRPILLSTSDEVEYTALIQAGQALHFKASTAATLTLKNARGLTVQYGGTTYTADANGMIEILMDADNISFTVSASDGAQKQIYFTFEQYIPE